MSGSFAAFFSVVVSFGSPRLRKTRARCSRLTRLQIGWCPLWAKILDLLVTITLQQINCMFCMVEQNWMVEQLFNHPVIGGHHLVIAAKLETLSPLEKS